MKEIKIKLASSDDQNQLEKTFQHFKDKVTMKNRAECYIIHNNTILAKDKDRIIGKMLWYAKEDPNCGVAEFEELYVFEEYRKKGIGSEVIKVSIKAVRNHFKRLGIESRRIYLFVDENNKIARNLYEKFGFENIANLGHLHSQGENDLFYMLDLMKMSDLSKNG
ncbi:MAG: GNAT family N-acetyltransferase [Promethearchaeota archaeon]|jgi:ribosomal protein S18 acetylase RimI-like enzyme